MKKKLVTLLLCICFAVTLCACSDSKDESDVKQEQETDEDDSEEESEDEKEKDDEKPVSEEAVAEADPTDLFLFDNTTQNVYLVSEDGDCKLTIETKPIIEENLPSSMAYVERCDATHQIYYLNDERGSGNVSIYINDNLGFRLVDSDLNYPNVSIVNGVICIDQSYAGDENRFVSRTYTPKDDGTFLCDEVNQTISEIIDKNGYYTNTRYYGDRETYGVAYCALKYGLVPLASENEILIFDPLGNYLDSITCDEEKKPQFKGYDGKYMAIEMEGSGYYTEEIDAYNFETGEMIQVATVPEGTYKKHLGVLDLEAGTIYYVITDYYYNDGDDTAEIHAYHMETGKDELIKTLGTKIGHDCVVNPGVQNFKAIGNRVYYLDETEGETKYFTAAYDGNSWSEKETDMIAKKYSYADFGKIDVMDYKGECPYCDKTALIAHHEYMVLDDRVKNYEKINEFIEGMAESEFATATTAAPAYTEEDCKTYLHNDTADYAEEMISKVRDVRRVLGHYIFVSNSDYYWPIGANHGISGYDNYLFDENTGETVTFDQIYTGSESKLKELVVKSACEMFDQGNVYFFAQDKTELEEAVSSEVSVNFGSISYYDDYITFDFMPYDLAPYSEGIVSIPVKYEDLGLNGVNLSSAKDTYDLGFVDVFGEHYTAHINKELPMHEYAKEGFDKKDGKYSYSDSKYDSVLGIDVSKYQGNVDFESVKKDGYDFVFLRLGFRGYGKEGTLSLDNMFEKNLVAATDAGLNVGVYFFSQAISEDEAGEEAKFVLDELKSVKDKYGAKYKISLPVVYDPESILDYEARTDDVSPKQFSANTRRFISDIEKNGYDAMLYCNMLWEIFNLDTDDILDGSIRIWYADYEPFPQTPYAFEVWQYTNEGSVKGVDGAADIDIWFKKK